MSFTIQNHLSPIARKFRQMVLGKPPLAGFLLAAALILVAGCSQDDPVNPADGNPGPDPKKSLPEVGKLDQSTPIAENPAVASMLSRARLVKPDQFEYLHDESNPDRGIFVFRIIDPNAADLEAGTILLGQYLGEPQEVNRATRQNDIVVVETSPADWSLVTDAGLLGFIVPLEAGGGEKDGVTWTPWRLEDTGHGPIEGLMTSSGAPVNAADFDPDDFLFENFSLCGGDGDATELCLDFDIRIVDGHFNLEGDTHFNFEAGDCFDPTSLICDFNPIENISAYAWQEMDAALDVNVSGGGHIGLEKCFFGYCLPDFAAVRDFEVAGMAGSLKLGLVVGIQLGVTEMEFETGFSLEQYVEAGAGWSSSGGFSGIWEATGDFDTSFDMVSSGNGFVKIYVGPKLEVRFDALTEDDVFNLEIGVFPFTRGQMDLDDLLDDCPNYTTTIDAGVEAVVEANLDFLILEPEFDFVFSTPAYVLAQFWGTGNLKIHTDVTGIDLDPNYRVSAWRSDPIEPPGWSETFTKSIGVNQTAAWYGESCRVFRPPFLDPIWSNCGLVATDHEVMIDEIMWNCALAGAAHDTICINKTGDTDYTFEINCISVFEALCDYLDDSLRAGLIRNAGITNALCSKFQAADEARTRGDFVAASNILGATLNQLDAQSGKGVDPAVAGELRLRIGQVVGNYLGVQRMAWK